MSRENIEEILKSIGSEDVPAEVRKIARETSRDFSEPLMRPKRHIFLEYIMKSQITKLAAAAVIIIGVLIILTIIPSTSGVAWAELVERVEGIKTVAYQMRATMKGLTEGVTDQPMKIEMQAKFGYDVGFYIKGCTQVENKKIATNTYVLFDEGAIVSVIPTEKKYIKMKLTDDLLAKMKKENGDPRTTLKEMMEHEYTELGKKTINGIEVEGIEVTDPVMGGGMFEEFAAQLWCDVETDLPVLMTMKGSSKDGEVSMDMVMDNFDWDVEIDPIELEPNIPEDYELLAETQFGITQDANDFVEILGFFAEFTDGKYPSSLSGMTVVKEFTDALQVKFAIDPPSDDGPSKEIMSNIVKLQTIGMSYAMMVKDGNDPAYYGDKVTAEFPHAVLMRWKIADDTYRVIFGDLTIEDASSEELAELEALPLNLKPIAIKPEPADGTVGTPLAGIKLSWIPGAYATGHKVYFGTSLDELAFLAEVTEPNYIELPVLERETTYYWRVDEVQSDGSVVTGNIWSFYTGGLVAWWKLDDGTGDVAADSAGTGLDGTLVGDTTWADGKIGGALVFDGNDDYVEIGKDPDFDITNQITVAAWIKVGAFDRKWQAIVAKGDSTWRLHRDRDKSALGFACTGLLVPGTRWGSVRGTVDVNDGQWHHAAGVYDGQNIYLYVDGKLDTSKEASGTIKISDQPIYIGENAERPKRFWNGLIDDVRVYSYGLSADEVAAIYTGQVEQK
ncbi:MAG: LamG domain-containing protein [Planctomycetota bacterium]